MPDDSRNDDAAVIVVAIDPNLQHKPIDFSTAGCHGPHSSAKTCSLLICATTATVGQNVSRRSCDMTRVQGRPRLDVLQRSHLRAQ